MLDEHFKALFDETISGTVLKLIFYRWSNLINWILKYPLIWFLKTEGCISSRFKWIRKILVKWINYKIKNTNYYKYQFINS